MAKRRTGDHYRPASAVPKGPNKGPWNSGQPLAITGKRQGLMWFGRYAENMELAVWLASPAGERILTVTTNTHYRPGPGCVVVKTWSENEGVVAALEAANYMKATGTKVQTGFDEAIEMRILEPLAELLRKERFL